MTREELEHFYNREKDHMHKIAAHCLGSKDAEDVVQDTFMRVFRNLATIDGAASAGYVKKTFCHAIIDAARKRKRRREILMDEVPEDEEPVQRPGDLLKGHLVVQACRVIFQQAVARLSAKQRRALELWLATEGAMGQALAILRQTEPDASPADYAGRVHQAKERLREVSRDYRELFAQLPAITLWKLLNEVVCENRSQPEGGES